jgi:predicted phage tail protein
VRVRAATGAGVGPPSNEVEVIVGTPQPRAPTGLVAAVDAQAVSLTWSAVEGPLDQYVLDVGSAPGLSDLVRGASLGPVTSARFERVPAGRYYVRVRAINGTGSSPPSAEVIVLVAGTAAQRTR